MSETFSKLWREVRWRLLMLSYRSRSKTKKRRCAQLSALQTHYRWHDFRVLKEHMRAVFQAKYAGDDR